MTRLVSGRVLKTPSANVSAERYQFIEISEVEPDLGLPPANGYVFTSDTEGTRSWIQLSTDNVAEGSNLYYTDDRAHANLKLSSIGDLFDVTTANIEIAQALVWDGNLFVPVFVNSEVGNVADLAVRVLNLENFTTANIAEASSNLYFTNSRVLDALVEANVIVNDLFVSGDLVVQGNSAVLNVSTLIVEDKNIVLANGAASASIADGAGITIEGADANIVYRESGDKIEINKNLDVTGNIIAGSGGGGSITGANIIIGETLVSNLLQVDTAISNLVITDSIQFNTSADIEVSEGEMAWNSSDGTLDIGLQYGDVVLQVGQETHYVVRNNTGETIENGTAVYCDGVTVGSGRIQANLMIGDGSIDPVQFLGLATHDITSGINGVVTYFGYVRGLDTRGTANTALSVGDDPGGWAVGDKLYVHPTAPGKLTKIEPEAPNTKICVAVIVNRHENVGVLFVRPTTNLRLTKLSDVQIANVESNQFLVYDNNRWENITVDTDNILEGSNLYYTNSRVVSAVTPLLTTANVLETDNLYYTNARVDSRIAETSVNALSDVDITSITTGQILSWDGSKFIPGSADIALFSEFSNSASFANVVGSLEGLTTDDLTEGSSNLYFTTRRAIDSFTPGRGIIITEAGTISSTDDSDLYNVAIDNSVYEIVSSEGKAIISINSSPDDASYLVHSIQLTNIEDTDILVSGNIEFISGQTVDLLNEVRMPVGSSLEILEKSLVLLPGDIVNLRTAGGNVSVAATYESVFDDESFINPALTIASADVDTLLLNSNLSYAIIETIKVVNLDSEATPVKIKVADANNNAKGYLVYNLSIPKNSIVDVLQKPKRIENGDKLFVSYANNANSNAISVFLSGRLGAVSGVEIVPASIDGTPGNTTIAFATTEAEGSTLYYTFTEV